MYPIKTAETNAELRGTGDVLPLPIVRSRDEHGPFVESCWRPSWREWLKLLVTRRVYFICRGATHPPVYLGADSDAAATQRQWRDIIADYERQVQAGDLTAEQALGMLRDLNVDT